MSFWRQLTHGIRALLKRSQVDRDIDDEIQHYLDQATAAHIAGGYSPEEARRAARIELGGVTHVREQVRSAGWEHVVETAYTDLRYGARRLRSEPVFTAVAVLTLALGVGATTAIFSAVHPILLEPLPYPDPERIVVLWEDPGNGLRIPGTFGMYRELASRARSFQALAVLRAWQPTMIGADQPERFNGQRVSAAYFQVLGVEPALGRAFERADDRPGGPNVTILSHALWERRFGGDSTIIGRTITLDDDADVVIGVMPESFENVLAPETQLWAPLQYGITQGRAWGHHLRTVGRLRDGVPVERAEQELDAIGRAVIAELQPETYAPETRFVASSLRGEITRGVKPAILAILGAVLLLLAIACVNVTNLLLARGVRRRGEFALRVALGAQKGRVVRQLLTESLLLAAMGGLVGMAAAVLGVRALLAVSPPGLPRVDSIGVHAPILMFGLSVTTLIGLAFGMIPALQAARSDPNRDLQRESRQSTGGHRRTRSALVVAEVALALVLLVSSGLLLRSLGRLFAVTAGFDASQLLTMQIQTSGSRFDDDSVTNRFFAQALEAVREVPGVTAAALTSQLPLSGDDDVYGVHFDPAPPDDVDRPDTFRYAVSPGYFETMRIPVLRGRSLEERDRAGAPLVAVVSESMARRRLPGRDPLGQRLRIGSGPLYTIVGMVGDVKQRSLALPEADAVYTTVDQWRFADGALSLVVRARGDAPALAPAIRAAVWSVDKDQPIVRVATMDDLVAASGAQRRFTLTVFGVFAVAALVLAAAGIYGVLSGSVAERTREIGVRAALGASRGKILGLVMRQGMTLTAVGIVLGVVGAAAASEAIAALLFGVSRLDPVTYVVVVALLVVVAMVACGVPAWRAARLDLVSTLRAE